MWKKIAIGGAIAAAALGSGTAALATSGSTTPGSPTPGSPTTSTSTSAAHAKHPGLRALTRRALHAQWVTGAKGSSTFVTHDAINGEVKAVSPTSITIEAADKTSQTYLVTSTTKIRERAAGKGASSTISAVHVGDHAVVIGTGTTTLTATGILDVKK